MGRIRTRYVKLKTEKILNKYRDRFTTDFAENKRTLDKIADIGSKTLRNKMAGYITKKIKKEKAK